MGLLQRLFQRGALVKEATDAMAVNGVPHMPTDPLDAANQALAAKHNAGMAIGIAQNAAGGAQDIAESVPAPGQATTPTASSTAAAEIAPDEPHTPTAQS